MTIDFTNLEPVEVLPIVTKPLACKFCKFWRGIEPVCDHPDNNAVNYIGFRENTWSVTEAPPNFGCVHWEQNS